MKYSIILIFALLFFQCSEEKIQKNKNEITIDLGQKVETSVFDLVDSVTLVPLESSDSCLIASIHQIEKKNDTLYIYDMHQKAFFCFKTDGKYLFKIAQKGNGPKEYQHIEYFSVSETGEIFLLEPWGNVYHYNKNGEFIQKIKLPTVLESYNEIHARNSSFVILSISGDILYYSRTGNSYQTYHIYNRMNNFFLLRRTSIYHDSIMTVSLFDNQVSKITQNGLIPSWKWNFKKNNNTKSNIEKLINQQMQYDPNDHTTIMDYIGDGKLLKQFIYTSYESSRFHIALMEYKNDFLHVFHDKKTDNSQVFIKTKENTVFHTCTYTNDTFIYYDQSLAQNWRNLTCVNQEVLGDKYDTYTTYENDADRNPTIILFHLKK